MHVMVLVSVIGLPLVLSLPYEEVSLRPRATNPSIDGPSTAVLGGGFSQSLSKPASLEVSRIMKRAPSALENDPPPSTQFQNIRDNLWDEYKRDRVVKAWKAAKELANHAKQSLAAIAPGSEEYQRATQLIPACSATKKGTADFNNCLRHFIAGKNLAYTQLFGANPEMLATILQNFQTVLDKVEDTSAPNRRGQDLYLTASSIMMNSATKKDECAGGTYALVMEASQVQVFKDVGGVQPPDTAYVLNFCDPFFQMDRMETQLEALQASGNLPEDRKKICDLDHLDSTARVMLHDLPWTLDTNPVQGGRNVPPDITHFETASSYGTEPSVLRNKITNQKMHTISFSSKNADSYAWMGIYNYFNNLDKCQGVQYTGPFKDPAGCTDVWPSRIDKVVNNMWANYPSGND